MVWIQTISVTKISKRFLNFKRSRNYAFLKIVTQNFSTFQKKISNQNRICAHYHPLTSRYPDFPNFLIRHLPTNRKINAN